MLYRGYEIDTRSVVGGTNISKDGEFVDWVNCDLSDAKLVVDGMIEQAAEYRLLNSETATRSPNSTGKWHRIAYDDTACHRFVFGNWVTKPTGEIDPEDLCKQCWPET